MGKINIAGAGLAGLWAAISLARHGRECNLISFQPSERAQSVLAEGGINAAVNAMGERDTVTEHFFDTIMGGAELADADAVMGLVSRAPDLIYELLKMGVPFHKENGTLIQRNFGGQKKKRTAYAKSSTGKVIMTALIDEARKYESIGAIKRFPHHKIMDIIIDKGICRGIKIYNTRTNEMLFLDGSVILATGGLNGLFPGETTGTVYNTGDVTAQAFSNGAELSNLEFIQYHPTTVKIPGKRMLISEAARGEGGRLFTLRNGRPWYFMEELYPELGNLMPRDVISREMFNIYRRDDCNSKVYLDLEGLSKNIWRGKLSDMREEIINYLNIDPAKQPIEVSPGIHFFMGGVKVDVTHRTNIKGLYAAGECACQYHGANRLGGNSMLGALFGGECAAKSAAEDNLTGESYINLGKITDKERHENRMSPIIEKSLSDALKHGLDIIRDEESISRSIERVDAILAENITAAGRKRAMLGKAMLLCALDRKESRGAHWRSDYPERNDGAYKRTTVCSVKDDKISVEFKAISDRRAEHEIQA